MYISTLEEEKVKEGRRREGREGFKTTNHI
jgi:hypothetical protein